MVDECERTKIGPFKGLFLSSFISILNKEINAKIDPRNRALPIKCSMEEALGDFWFV